MFINRQEPAFAAISTYPKPVDIELQASIAKHKEGFGFIDLDDPNAPPRKKAMLRGQDWQTAQLYTVKQMAAPSPLLRKVLRLRIVIMLARQLDNFSCGFTIAPRKAHKQPVRSPLSNVQKKRKPSLGMKTVAGSKVLETLLSEGVYHIADFGGSRNSLSTMLVDIRDMGYEVRCIKSGRYAVSYELVRK